MAPIAQLVPRVGGVALDLSALVALVVLGNNRTRGDAMSTTIEADTERRTSTGAPMVRHLIRFEEYEVRIEGGQAMADPKPGALPKQTALCGYEWDRMGVSKGPVCGKCRAIHDAAHPGMPLRI